ncbi:MAG: hypothetical protein ACK5L7_08000 [Paludibacteraceae bacterium]
MKLAYYILSILTVSIAVASCNNHSGRYKIQRTQENSSINIKIKRFDKDLIQFDTANATDYTDKLYQKYPKFVPVYIGNILDVNSSNTAEVGQLFAQFISDSTIQRVNQKTFEIFADVSDIESDLSQAFSYINDYFPPIPLPDIYFYVSGFNRAVMIENGILGIGTDFYLGADYPLYKEFTYDYLLYNMRKEMVSIDIVSVVLFNYFVFDGKQNRLMDNMLHRGKILYLLSSFMPDKKMEDILGYSLQQMQWAEKYENNIWKTIVGQKDLFSTNMQLIGKYLNDAPFTTPVSQDSPGRLGIYIGWKIISEYMKNNPSVTLQELMQNGDYQKILEQSGYRP